MTKNGWCVNVPRARRVGVLNKHALHTAQDTTIKNTDLFPGRQVADEIAKPQVSINSNDSTTDRKKTATGNGNLESNECSSDPDVHQHRALAVAVKYLALVVLKRRFPPIIFFSRVSYGSSSDVRLIATAPRRRIHLINVDIGRVRIMYGSNKPCFISRARDVDVHVTIQRKVS